MAIEEKVFATRETQLRNRFIESLMANKYLSWRVLVRKDRDLYVIDAY